MSPNNKDIESELLSSRRMKLRVSKHKFKTGYPAKLAEKPTCDESSKAYATSNTVKQSITEASRMPEESRDNEKGC